MFCSSCYWLLVLKSCRFLQASMVKNRLKKILPSLFIWYKTKATQHVICSNFRTIKRVGGREYYIAQVLIVYLIIFSEFIRLTNQVRFRWLSYSTIIVLKPRQERGAGCFAGFWLGGFSQPSYFSRDCWNCCTIPWNMRHMHIRRLLPHMCGCRLQIEGGSTE